MKSLNISITKTQVDDLIYWLEHSLEEQTDYDNRDEILSLLANIKNQTRETPKSYGNDKGGDLTDPNSNNYQGSRAGFPADGI